MNCRRMRTILLVIGLQVLMLSALACGPAGTATPTPSIATVPPAQPTASPPAPQPITVQPGSGGLPAGQQPADQPPAEGPMPVQNPDFDLPVIDYFYVESSPAAGCFYLRWGLHDATAAYLDGVVVCATGSTEVCPDKPTSYTLRAENVAGSVEERVDVEGPSQ